MHPDSGHASQWIRLYHLLIGGNIVLGGNHVYYAQHRASSSMTSMLLSVQSGSIPTDQDQGNGQLRPSQVTVSKISSAQLRERDQSSHSSIYAQSSTMAPGQEITPVGEVAAILYDNTSMNGSNGPASPIVVEPGDREGPTKEMLEREFYMYAPQFHWTLTIGAEDQPARSAIESITHE